MTPPPKKKNPAFLGFYPDGHKDFTEQSVLKYEKFEKIHISGISIWMANTEKKVT